MSDDHCAVAHPRGRIFSVPLHLETHKQQKSTKKRSLFRRRNKKQSSTRREVPSPRPGTLSKSHINTPLLDDFDDSEEDHDFIKWEAGTAISDTTGSQDEGGSLRSDRSNMSGNSSQRSRSPGRLLNRTAPPTSIRSERSYQDCSSIDASIFSNKGEELTTISEASAVKKEQPKRHSHSSSTSTSRRKSGRRSITSLGLFGSDCSSVDHRSSTSENLNRAGSSEISCHLGSASVGSCSDQLRRHRTPRKSTGALGSYLETPLESRERRTSRSVIMDSQSKGSRKEGYIISFLGTGKDDDDDDDVQPEEAPSLIASTITSTTKSKQEEEMYNLDDQSHASTIISRGLNYLEKFYEECT
jgi:hypothetical protein